MYPIQGNVFRSCFRVLNETAESKVLLDDDIYKGLAYASGIWNTAKLTVYSCHDESDLCCICGAGEVRVDLLCLVLVQADESVQYVVAGKSVVITALIIWEVVLHGADRKLLLESINLVQKQDD